MEALLLTEVLFLILWTVALCLAYYWELEAIEEVLLSGSGPAAV